MDADVRSMTSESRTVSPRLWSRDTDWSGLQAVKREGDMDRLRLDGVLELLVLACMLAGCGSAAVAAPVAFEPGQVSEVAAVQRAVPREVVPPGLPAVDGLEPVIFAGTDGGYSGPASVGTGWQTLEFTDDGGQGYEVLVIHLPGAMGTRDLDALLTQGLPDGAQAVAQFELAPGEKTQRQLWLAPGSYVVWQRPPASQGDGGGHVMLHLFRVGEAPVR
jgi:hypothetical protein